MITPRRAASPRPIRRWAIRRATSRAQSWSSRSPAPASIFPMARRTSCRSARTAAKPHRDADHAKSRRGAWRLAAGLRRQSALAAERASTKAGICIPRSSSPRYAAVYAFFLAGLEAASDRLKAFVEKAALASLVRRCLRRRRDRPGPAQFLPARHRVAARSPKRKRSPPASRSRKSARARS